MKSYKVPEAAVMRLSVYGRYLKQLRAEGVDTVSSVEIARGVGVSPVQVRKDLAYFGEFGIRGVGYRVDELLGHLIRILGLNRIWKVVIIGAGKLGSALARYRGFTERGFEIAAILDVNEQSIGRELSGIPIQHLDVLQSVVRQENIKIGIITVPAAAAQDVTDQLVEAGITAILNFSPRALKVPSDVVLKNIDLSMTLEFLSFKLASREELHAKQARLILREKNAILK